MHQCINDQYVFGTVAQINLVLLLIFYIKHFYDLKKNFKKKRKMSASNHTKRIIDSLKDDHDDEPDKKKVPIGGEIELVDDIELIDDDVPVQSNIDEYSLIEKNVGICEYVNPDVYGVFGIVKQR
jgi:hypothetical protein